MRAAEVDGTHESRVIRKVSGLWSETSFRVGWSPLTEIEISTKFPKGLDDSSKPPVPSLMFGVLVVEIMAVLSGMRVGELVPTGVVV